MPLLSSDIIYYVSTFTIKSTIHLNDLIPASKSYFKKLLPRAIAFHKSILTYRTRV